MGYSPKLLLVLALQAFIFGSMLGGFYELLGGMGAWIGGQSDLKGIRWVQERELPLIGRVCWRTEEKASRRISSRVFLFFGDILFCIAAGLGILLLAYVGNNGRVRWFILLGTLVGFSLIRKALGEFLQQALGWIAVAVCVACRYALYVLLYPFRALIRGGIRITRAAFTRIRQGMDARRDRKFHFIEYQRLLSEASAGFGCMNVPRENVGK